MDDDLQAIAELVVADGPYAEVPWTGIRLVADVGAGRKRVHGYVYAAPEVVPGGWEAQVPDGFAVLQRLVDLHERSAGAGRPWRRLLLQLQRTGPGAPVRVRALLDVDGDQPWTPDASVPHELPERLRPPPL